MINSSSVIIRLIFSTAFVLHFSSIAVAEATPKIISNFIKNECLDCHDSSSKEGNLNLESLKFDLSDPDSFHSWERIFDRVDHGEMPPKDAEQPKPWAKKKFIGNLHSTLENFDQKRVQKNGRVLSRRLTRFQYENTVQDLLGIKIPLQNYLPEDPTSDGFNTVSKGQQVSHHLLAKYLETADIALNEAFDRALRPTQSYKKGFKWYQLKYPNRGPSPRQEHKDIVSWSVKQSFYGRMPATTVPETGWYRVKLKVQAVNPPKSGRVWCLVNSGMCFAQESTLYWIANIEAIDKVTEHEYVAWIRKGHRLQIRPEDSSLPLIFGNRVSRAGNLTKKGHPGIAIKSIQMERIHPGASSEQLQKTLFGNLALKEIENKKTKAEPKWKKDKKSKAYSDPRITNNENELQIVTQYQILSNEPEADFKNLVIPFASKAFRRPVTAEEIQPYIQLSQGILKNGSTFEDALKAAYRGIMCSPRFLYFEEAPGELDNHALATRLSYFLWSTMPDDELRSLADEGKLNDQSTLTKQVDRMIAHSKFKSVFSKNFTDQWLNLTEIDFTTPDGKLYPEYDEVLKHSMLDETRAFFSELIDKNLSVRNLVDSEFSMLNSRLARHYNIEWPGDTGFQNVSFKPNDHRGGIITHGSILKVTANGTTTSPVTRGLWVLERIMGVHVPPPPSDVPAVEPDIRGATTIREQLKKHRDLDSCAACHVKIDPPGFALESYDVIGGFRTRYRVLGQNKKNKKKMNRMPGPAVDASYQMADGKKFAGIEQFKNILLSRPKQITKTFASQLVTYGTGAAISFSDRDDIEEIVEQTQNNNFGTKSIIHAVVQSQLFRKK